jgi:tRNA A-37 threonylcarbamoyl transferase component Bud32
MLNVADILQQGRYRVNKRLGAGGMATVYEVFDRRLQSRFALKEAYAQTADEQAQFEREAQMLAQLDHPVLPRVVDHFAERNGQFLVMELVPGEDLETLLAAQGRPFDVATVLQWADQLLDALEYLHSQRPQIIHRDIKPANLKVAGTGRVKLLDFGIAKQQLAGGQTVTVAKAFSLEYSPIEQFSASTHTDVRSDIYALGATLYHLLTNQTPTPAPERFNGKPLVGPQTYNPDCPPALAQIILRAMALKAESRFQSAAEFRAAIQRVRDQITRPISAPAGRRQMLLAAGATLVVAVLGYVVGTWALTPRAVIGSAPTAAPPSVAVSAAGPIVPPTAAPAATEPAATPTALVIVATPTALPPTALAPAIAQPRIIARGEWGAATAKGFSGGQQPHRITLNHDGQELPSDQNIPDLLRRIQTIHQRKWPDIAWHYIVDLDGNIYEGRATTDRGDTNYHYDTTGIIAIGVLGDYDTQTPSQPQLDAIVQLMAWLCGQYGIPVGEIYPHSYFANQSSLTDPKITSPGRNFDVDAIRRRVADRLAGR